jgi:hypothetical protein
LALIILELVALDSAILVLIILEKMDVTTAKFPFITVDEFIPDRTTLALITDELIRFESTKLVFMASESSVVEFIVSPGLTVSWTFSFSRLTFTRSESVTPEFTKLPFTTFEFPTEEF